MLGGAGAATSAAPAPRLVAAPLVEVMGDRVLVGRRCGRRVDADEIGAAGRVGVGVPGRLVELPRAAVRPTGAHRAVVAVALDGQRAFLEAREVALAARPARRARATSSAPHVLRERLEALLLL